MNYKEAFSEGTCSVKEAAAMLGISIDRIKTALKNRNIPFESTQPGNTFNFDVVKYARLPSAYIRYLRDNNINLLHKRNMMQSIIDDFWEHEKRKEYRKQYSPNFASDCIHLYACRLQRKHCLMQFGKKLTMCCTEDCPAYLKKCDEEELVSFCYIGGEFEDGKYTYCSGCGFKKDADEYVDFCPGCGKKVDN